MANKFQKSVLQRLEQENQKIKKGTAAEVVPENQSAPSAEPEMAAPAPQAALQEELPQPVARRKDSPTAPPVVDVSAYLRREPARTAKNKTFYLDTEVIEGVKAAAKNQKVTDSKLVNDILRTVLGLPR